MSAIIFVEGGPAKGVKNSKTLRFECRKGFSKLFDKCGYKGRSPKVVLCGGRGEVLKYFGTEHRQGTHNFVAMLIDSEEPLHDLNSTWGHLNRRDGWNRLKEATDDQVLPMTTCMETWIVTDRSTLKRHYGHMLQENALPPLVNLEARSRHDVQDKLMHATRECKNRCEKGKRSFAVLALLNPTELEKHLPSFARMKRILDTELR